MARSTLSCRPLQFEETYDRLETWQNRDPEFWVVWPWVLKTFSSAVAERTCGQTPTAIVIAMGLVSSRTVYCVYPGTASASGATPIGV